MIKKLLVAALLLAPLGASAAIRSVAQQTVGAVMMTTPIFVMNGFNNATTGMSTSVTSYGPFLGGVANSSGSWVTGAPTGIQSPIATAGTISNLKVFALTTISQGSYTVSLNQAGSVTALTCAVSSGTQTCSDTTHSVTVAPGDLLAVQEVPSGTPTAQTLPFYISMTFTSTVGQESPVFGGNEQLSSMSTTVQQFASFGGQITWNATENLVSSVVPVAGTIDQLYASTALSPGGSASYAFLIEKNGSPTSLTCTVSAAATACNDTNTGHAISLVAGDLISVSSTPASSPTARGGLVGVRWVPTTQNKSIVFVQPQIFPSTATGSVYGQFGGTWANNASDLGAVQTVAPVNFTATDAYISYCPGAGASAHRDLRLRTTATPNTATTNSSLFVAAANGTTACNTRTAAGASVSVSVTAGQGLAAEEFISVSGTAATQFAGSFALTVP